MRYHELANVEPQVGDVLGIEFGNTLVEATIQELRDDGVVIALDHRAVEMLSEAAAAVAGLGSPDTYSQAPTAINEPVLRPDNVRYPSFNRSQRTAQTSAPAKQEYTLSQCRNAIDWGTRALGSANVRTKLRLRQGKDNEALAYLIGTADRTNAYNRFDFNEEQLRDGEAYLGYVMNDSSIQSWSDVARKQSNQGMGESAKPGLVAEAEYQGRKVPLGKPMKGDVKKSKVYVMGPKGNVVKVNFGDPNMRIKKSSPKNRKSFRARHNCDNPGPRTKARYWSCRAW